MNTIEDKATTRPWETFTTGNYELGGSNARKGWSIGICGPSRSKKQNVCTIDCGNAELEHEYERQKDDAKLIVKAVNLHDELIEACEYALNFIKWNDCQEFKEYGSLKSDLKEVLTKAQA